MEAAINILLSDVHRALMAENKRRQGESSILSMPILAHKLLPALTMQWSSECGLGAVYVHGSLLDYIQLEIF